LSSTPNADRDYAVYRAPMRARDRDAPTGSGAAFGIEHDLVGIGDRVAKPPATLEDAVAAVTGEYGAKAGRMLYAFAAVPDGAFVWTCVEDGTYRLGRLAGGWRYDDSRRAAEVGICHVRPARWLDRPFGEHDVPAAVADTFARGGRNFQRTHGHGVETHTAQLWSGAGEE
jgi:hypothetical protein